MNSETIIAICAVITILGAVILATYKFTSRVDSVSNRDRNGRSLVDRVIRIERVIWPNEDRAETIFEVLSVSISEIVKGIAELNVEVSALRSETKVVRDLLKDDLSKKLRQ